MSTRPSRVPQTSPTLGGVGRRRLLIAAVFLVVAAMLLADAFLQRGSGRPARSADTAPSVSASAPGSSPSAAQDDPGRAARAALARRLPDDPFAQGRVDAPVVLIEYADFQCPFCREFAQNTEAVLVRQYVPSGELRIEWRNFPIFGTESVQAARAAWAAGQQGRFWPFHDLLYTHGPQRRNSGVFSADRLVQFARAAGVRNLTKFRTDYASAAARKAVDRDTQEGYQLGIPSTPAFLINGTPILGAQPLDQFRQAIDQALRAASGASAHRSTGAGS